MWLHLYLPAAQHGAPCTQIVVMRLEKVDWPLEIRRPGPSLDLSETLVNLDKRSRKDDGIKRVVLAAYVAIRVVRVLKRLQGLHGEQSPLLDHPSDITGLLLIKQWIDLGRHVAAAQAGIARKMSSRRGGERLR